jgi:hypothetical protein
MKSLFSGGSLYVNRDAGFGSLLFGRNDLTFSGSLVVYLWVDGTSPAAIPDGDQISLDGANTFTIDNSGTSEPSLVVTTVGGPPAAGWAFDLIIAPNLVGTFDPLQVSFQGNTPAGGYTVSYPFGPPRSVRITVPPPAG